MATPYTQTLEAVLEALRYANNDFDEVRERSNEIVEVLVPDDYANIIREWADLPMADSDRWQELGMSPDATIKDRMQTDLYLYYETLVSRVIDETEASAE